MKTEPATKRLMQAFGMSLTEMHERVVSISDGYEKACMKDPVGMGRMKDNGDGTFSLNRPKEFAPNGS